MLWARHCQASYPVGGQVLFASLFRSKFFPLRVDLIQRTGHPEMQIGIHASQCLGKKQGALLEQGLLTGLIKYKVFQ